MKYFLYSAIPWYLIGAFIASNLNPLEWMNIGKIIYLIFVFLTWDKIEENLKKLDN